MSTADHPLQAGTGLALLSAALFGVSTPLLRHFGAGCGPFTSAGLLYAGAALASVPLATGAGLAPGAPLRKEHALRLAGVAVAGAVVAPVCLAWGLARTPATVGSLLLASEAFFTVGLAALVYHEPIGRRVWAALVLVALASALLVHGSGAVAGVGGVGALAVLGAALAWALDNTLTRPLADLDARQVVLAKSALGAALSLLLALHERHPSLHAVLGLLVTGALGYGLSLRVYLLAQRRVGAARTGSVFATAPFLGALAAWMVGEGALDATTLAAGALVAVAVTLHLAEKHGHEHTHEATEHEHTHRHDDGHHDHSHEPPVVGEHTHRHAHAATQHTHAHAPDLHHQHRH